MKRALPFLILLVIGIVVWVTWPRPNPPNRFEETRQRIEAFKVQLEKTRNEMQTAVEGYKPKEPHRIDDLATDAVEVLKGIPGVAKVTSNEISKPTARIIHVLDYHYVSKADFASESAGYSQEAINLLYQEFLLEAELIQGEHLALRQCLVKYYGLETAWAEGLALEGLRDYLETMELIKKAEKKSDDEGIQLTCLQYGTLGKLFRDGKIEAVLPRTIKYSTLLRRLFNPRRMRPGKRR